MNTLLTSRREEVRYEQTKGFLCDECDGYIASYEEYIVFQGVNYCENCFENHRFDLDLDEEGTELICSCCGEVITSGYYYRFDDEIFCLECIEDMKHVTTQEEKYLGRMD